MKLLSQLSWRYWLGFLYEFTTFIMFRWNEQGDDTFKYFFKNGYFFLFFSWNIFFFSKNRWLILTCFFFFLFVIELEQPSRASWTESSGSDTSRDPRGAQYRSQSHRRADGLSNFLRRALSGKLWLLFLHPID